MGNLKLTSRANQQELKAIEFYSNKIKNKEKFNLPVKVFIFLPDDIKRKYVRHKFDNGQVIYYNELDYLDLNEKEKESFYNEFAGNINNNIPSQYKGYEIYKNSLEGVVSWENDKYLFYATPFWDNYPVIPIHLSYDKQKNIDTEFQSIIHIPETYNRIIDSIIYNYNLTNKEIFDFIGNFYLPKVYEEIKKLEIKYESEKINEGLKLTSRASQQEKQREEYIRNILSKNINDVTPEEIRFIGDDNAKPIYVKIIDKLQKLQQEPYHEIEKDFRDDITKITFSLDDSGYYRIEFWDDFILLIKTELENLKITLYKEFKTVGELLDFLKKENISEGLNLKSRAGDQERQREEYINQILKKGLENLSNPEYNFLLDTHPKYTYKISDFIIKEMGDYDYEIEERQGLKGKFINSVTFELKDVNFRCNLPDLTYSYSTIERRTLSNGVSYNQPVRVFGSANTIKELIQKGKEIIEREKETFKGIFKQKEIKEGLKLTSRANQNLKQKIEYINKTQVNKSNWGMVLDDEYNPIKEVFDSVNEEKRKEITKLSEQIKYWYKRIKYYENELKEILNRRGLLSDNLELNPSLEDDDWINVGVLYYGYFYYDDMDIIGHYNIYNDTFDLDKDSLENIEKILTGGNIEDDFIKEGLGDKIKSRASQQEKQREEYINQILKKPIEEFTTSDLGFFTLYHTNLKKLKEKFERELNKKINFPITFDRISIIIYSDYLKNLFIGFSHFDILLVHPNLPTFHGFNKLGDALEKMKEYEENDNSKYDSFGKLNETNSELEGKEFVIPGFVKEEIKKYQKEYGMSSKRSNYLLNQNTISYYEIKRLKNFFDKNNDGIDFYLAGGLEMKSWIENILNQYRGQIHKKKETLYDIGLDNQFKKTHTKDKNKMVKPSLGIDKVPTTSRGIKNNL